VSIKRRSSSVRAEVGMAEVHWQPHAAQRHNLIARPLRLMAVQTAQPRLLLTADSVSEEECLGSKMAGPASPLRLK
jgi:hypothetical protein